MKSNVVRPKTKREVDFEKAVEIREKTAKHLNHFLKQNKTGLHFVRLSKFAVRMSIAEKSKYNTLLNRITKVPKRQSMGLYYSLEYKDGKNPKKANFIFAYSEQSSFYIKLPKEYRNDPNGYIKLLASLNWFVLIVHEEKYSSPIPMSLIYEHWGRAVSTAKGNKNRLQFYIPIQRIRCRKVMEGDGLFEDRNIIQELQELMV